MMPGPLDNPYVGPRTFTRQERDRFFGREPEARELLSLVISDRLTLFYAQSGAGKSSLVNTRLIPQLQAEQFLVMPVARVGGELPAGIGPVENIYALNLMLSLDQSQTNPARFARMSLPDFSSRLTTTDGEYFYFDDALPAGPPPAEAGSPSPPHVLIIDQFEEIVTTHPEMWPQREDFFRQLARLMANDPLLWVVLVLREDYVAALDPYAHLLPGRMQNRFYMQRMEHQAALEAVQKPAAQYGRPFAPGVAEQLVDNLRQIRVPGQVAPQPGQFVEPVQLQVVCFQLWQNLQGRPPGPITLADLQQAGDVDTALAQFYEQALAQTIRQTGVSEVELRTWFEEKLITEAGTRGIVYQGAETTAGLPNDAVEALAARFLLREEVRAGGAWYELVHDRFIEPIRQANRIWQERRLRQSPLIRDAQAWLESGKDPARLYRNRQLENTLAGLNLSQQDPLVQEFLSAGAEAQQARDLAQATARARRLRRFILLLALLLLAAVGAAGVALYQGQQARTSEARAIAAGKTAEARRIVASTAQAEAILAQAGAEIEAMSRATAQAKAEMLQLAAEEQSQSRLLAVQAIDNLPRRTNLALLLAVAANQITRTVEARSNLLELLQAKPALSGYLNGHTNRVWSVAFSPDGRTLASGGDDNRIMLWDVAARRFSAELPTGRSATLYSLAFSPNGRLLAAGNADGLVTLWNMAGRSPSARPLAGHKRAVFSVAFSPDGRTLASGSMDNTIILWDVATGRPLGPPLTGHSRWVWQVAFSPNGRILASVSLDQQVRLWDVAARRPLGPPLDHDNTVASVAFSPDGRTVAAGDGHGIIKLWDVSTHQELARLEEHNTTVWGLAFTPDGQTLVSGSGDGRIIVWDLATRRPLDRDGDNRPDFDLVAHGSVVYRLALSPDGVTLAAGGGDNSVSLWNLTRRQRLGRVAARQPGAVYNVAYSPDGRLMAIGRQDGLITLWDVANERPLGPPLQGHTGGINWVAFNPAGAILASGSQDNTIVLWDVSTLQPLGRLTGHTGNLTGLSFSPDGKTLASSAKDGNIMLWDVATHRPLGPPLVGHKVGNEVKEASAVAFSPDGKILASGGYDNNVVFWDTATRRPVRRLTGQTERVYALAFSPDGAVLASSTLGGTITLWDAATGRALTSFTDHPKRVDSVVFSPNSRIMASTSADKIIILWDVAARRRLGRPFTGLEGRVWSLAFSPDGRTLAAGGTGRTVTLWDVDFESWLERACALANRNLSRAEWEQFFAGEPYRKICPAAPLHPTLLEKGLEQVQAGNAQAAVARIEAFLDPALLPAAKAEVWRLVAESLLDEGRSAARQGDMKGAVAWFEQALALDPGLQLDPQAEARRAAALARLEQGRDLAALGKANAAALEFEQALALDPGLQLDPQAEARRLAAAALWEQGRALAEEQDIEAAAARFEQALALDPGLQFDPQAEARRLAARELLRQGQEQAARGQLDVALALYGEARMLAAEELSATDWEALCHLDGRPEVAARVLNACNRAAALAPDAAWVLNSRGRVLAQAGSETAAIEDLSAVVSQLRQNRWYRLGSADTEILLQKLAADFSPFTAGQLLEEGRDLARNGDVEGAAARFRQALEKDPGLDLNPEAEARHLAATALVDEGRDLARAGNVKEATARFRQALELDPDIGLKPEAEARRLAAQSRLKAGQELVAEGKINQAVAQFKKALTLNPDLDLDIAQELLVQGQQLARQGQINAALDAYLMAQKLDPTLEIPAGAWDTLCRFGSLWESAGVVIPACETAVRLAPQAAWTHDSRGLARALTGDYSGAVADFKFVLDRLQENPLFNPAGSPYSAWLAQLEAGKNPFGPAVLAELRGP